MVRRVKYHSHLLSLIIHSRDDVLLVWSSILLVYG